MKKQFKDFFNKITPNFIKTQVNHLFSANPETGFVRFPADSADAIDLSKFKSEHIALAGAVILGAGLAFVLSNCFWLLGFALKTGVALTTAYAFTHLDDILNKEEPKAEATGERANASLEGPSTEQQHMFDIALENANKVISFFQKYVPQHIVSFKFVAPKA